MARSLLFLPTEERKKGDKTMRRLVGISIKGLVAAGLVLVGTIYVAAEARQAVTLFCTTPTLNTPVQPAVDAAVSAKPATTGVAKALPQSNSKLQPQIEADAERAAEQQAS